MRQMPLLEHQGDKLVAGQAFWALPQDIVIYAFKNLTYSEAQVLFYLMGQKPRDDKFKGWQLSNINACVGCNDRTVRAALAKLKSLKFITESVENGNRYYTVNFDFIREIINQFDK